MALPSYGFAEPDLPFAGAAAVATYLNANGVATRIVDLNYRFQRRCEEILGQRLGRIPSTISPTDLISWAVSYEDEIVDKYCLRGGPLRSNSPFGLSALVEHNLSKIEPFLASEDNIFAPVLPEIFDLSCFDSGHNIIGISLTAPSQLLAALTLAHQLKKRNGNNVVVAGGAFVTLCLDAFLRPLPVLRDIDYAIPGDGEEPFLELIADARAGSSQQRDGIVYRVDSPRCSFRPRPPNPELVRHLPAPDYRLFEEPSRFTAFPYETARGCAWSRCKFCYHSRYYGNSYRPKPIARVVDDLQSILRRTIVETVHFSDAELSPVRFRQLATAIIDRGLRLSWWCLARVQPGWEPDLFVLGRQAGCKEIDWGLEHTSPRLTAYIGKPVDLDQAQQIFRGCHDAGIKVAVQTITGLPSETDEERQQLFDFLLEHQDLFSSQPNFFLLGRNTEFFEQRERYGIIASASDEDMFASGFEYLNRNPPTDVVVSQIRRHEELKAT